MQALAGKFLFILQPFIVKLLVVLRGRIGMMVLELLLYVKITESSEFSWESVLVKLEDTVIEFETFGEDALKLLVHGLLFILFILMFFIATKGLLSMVSVQITKLNYFLTKKVNQPI